MIDPPALPQPPAHALHPQVVQHQKRSNPIDVRSALLPQPLQFPVYSPRVLLRRGGTRTTDHTRHSPAW